MILNASPIQLTTFSIPDSSLGSLIRFANDFPAQLLQIPRSSPFRSGRERALRSCKHAGRPTRTNGAPTRHPQATLVYRSGVHAPWDRHSCDGNTNRRVIAPRRASRHLPGQSRNTYSFDSEPRRRTGSRTPGNAHRDQSTGSPRRSGQTRRRGHASGSRRANFDSDRCRGKTVAP